MKFNMFSVYLQCYQQQCAAAVLDVVVCTYGDTFFVNKGDLKKHSFLTSTILSILKQFNEADLRTISNEDDSSQLLGKT